MGLASHNSGATRRYETEQGDHDGCDHGGISGQPSSAAANCLARGLECGMGRRTECRRRHPDHCPHRNGDRDALNCRDAHRPLEGVRIRQPDSKRLRCVSGFHRRRLGRGPDLRLSLVGTPHSSRCDCVARRRDLHTSSWRSARSARPHLDPGIAGLAVSGSPPEPLRSKTPMPPAPHETRPSVAWRRSFSDSPERPSGLDGLRRTDDADTPPFAGASGRVKEGEKIDAASAPSAVSRVARGGCRRAL
jgi:hypothetical protein